MVVYCHLRIHRYDHVWTMGDVYYCFDRDWYLGGEQYGGMIAVSVRQRRDREDRQTRIELANPRADASHEGGLGSRRRTSGAQMDGFGHVVGF